VSAIDKYYFHYAKIELQFDASVEMKISSKRVLKVVDEAAIYRMQPWPISPLYNQTQPQTFLKKLHFSF
jgi:hypothetical protein